ncbi:sulfotransferase family protein [Stieleria sp. TO1_6]|uniref:sulfotransferase family 2 domain-containing protein n=1 Tax=Stieleria tagensis TaxID=2956795 RepID=UPI00209B0310|nr:sulfotransferase family 2 domain-containing protein [Stieleria tagensis]MCO8125280.1 sulfotransferase family protein [Stieleria tagensis]
MLLSRKHRFLFVHVYKNAGTSVSKALSPFTVYRFQRETVRVCKQIGLAYPSRWDATPCAGHATASQIRVFLGESYYRSLFSFAVVRNPWDWQVSQYTYIRKNTKHQQYEQFQRFSGFADYIRWRCDGNTLAQRELVCSPSGELLVDFLGRFENLNQDFDQICQRIGITARLPTLNVSKQARDFRQFYDDQTVELVRQAYQDDIRYFGYEFESGKLSESRLRSSIAA